MIVKVSDELFPVTGVEDHHERAQDGHCARRCPHT